MSRIIAAQELRAEELPDIEPTTAELIAVDVEVLHGLDLVQERMEAELAELALYGARDEFAERRFRRAVHVALAEVAATAHREVAA